MPPCLWRVCLPSLAWPHGDVSQEGPCTPRRTHPSESDTSQLSADQVEADVQKPPRRTLRQKIWTRRGDQASSEACRETRYPMPRDACKLQLHLDVELGEGAHGGGGGKQKNVFKGQVLPLKALEPKWLEPKWLRLKAL